MIYLLQVGYSLSFGMLDLAQISLVLLHYFYPKLTAILGDTPPMETKAFGPAWLRSTWFWY